MIYAKDKNSNYITASKKAFAVCPCCSTELIPKCGEEVVWHWAHYPNVNCIYSSYSDNNYSYDWKLRVKGNKCEVNVDGTITDIIGFDSTQIFIYRNQQERVIDNICNSKSKKSIWICNGIDHELIEENRPLKETVKRAIWNNPVYPLLSNIDKIKLFIDYQNINKMFEVNGYRQTNKVVLIGTWITLNYFIQRYLADDEIF